MATPIVRSSSSSSVPSLPPPLPKSPPDYPDLYGKRREMARVQMFLKFSTFKFQLLNSDSLTFTPAGFHRFYCICGII
ncbi:hypothetical protein Lal_00038370 [Lupinus albus]|nr:hypothetical protein Lal_00038370 [Lupinus albus]